MSALFSVPTLTNGMAPSFLRLSVGDGRVRSAGDLLSGRRDREPAGAECRQALAVRLTGLRVLREAVERVAVVRDLGLPVGPPRGSELRGAHPAAGCRLSACPQRRPEGGAGAEALALPSRVLLEQVKGAAPRIDEDLAQTAPASRRIGLLRDMLAPREWRLGAP